MAIIRALDKGVYVDVIVDDDKYEDLNVHAWSIKGKYAGRSVRLSKGSNSKQTVIKMHRYLTNAPKGTCVDHINNNKLDNRLCNLRICSHSENMKNINSHRGESKYKGVSRDKRLKFKKWRATIRNEKTYINLGYYVTEIEAAIAYNNAAIIYHGEFASLNTID